MIKDPNTGLSLTALTNIQEGKPTKRNTSGVRGVHWNENKQKSQREGSTGTCMNSVHSMICKRQRK